MSYYEDDSVTLHHGDAAAVLAGLEAGSVDCCVTSPPYYNLRDYGVDGQIGNEQTPDEYVAALVRVFREVRRVLADDGVMFLNLGDSYASGSVGRREQEGPPESLRAFAYGTDGTALADYPATGSAYSGLCGECRDAWSSRTADKSRPTPESSWHHSQTTRDSGHPGCVAATPLASAPDAPASTTPGSWPPPLDECYHCASCGVCLSILATSERDALACARMAQYRSDTWRPEWANRTTGMDVSERAWGNSTKASRQSSRRDRATVAAPRGVSGGNLPAKNLLLMPHRVAMALQADGWILRNAICWTKANAMPESVTDRLSTRYELIFMLTRSRKYWFDLDPIREEHVSAPGREGANCLRGQKAMRPVGPNSGAYSVGGRNPGDVWEIATQPYPGAHFAVFPPEIPRRAILAGCVPKRCSECGHVPAPIVEKGELVPSRDGSKSTISQYESGHVGAAATARDFSGVGSPSLPRRERTTTGWTDCGHNAYRPGTVLDPFHGSGTTGMVAQKLGRRYVGIDLNAEYLDLSLRTRLADAALPFEGVS